MITEMVGMDMQTGIYQFETKEARRSFIDLLGQQHHHGVQTDLGFATSELDGKFIVAVRVTTTEVNHTEREDSHDAS